VHPDLGQPGEIVGHVEASHHSALAFV